MRITKKELTQAFTVDIEVENNPVYQMKNKTISHNTTSLTLGTSSGIHAWHNDYYLRTMRFGKNEAIATYLMINHPELCEDDVLRPHDTLCVRIPVKAPEGSILRTETAIDTLERVKKFASEWIKHLK